MNTRRKPKYKGSFKDAVRCRKCGWCWKPCTGYAHEPCPHCGLSKDVRLRVFVPNLKHLNAWRKQRHGSRKVNWTRAYRQSAILLVGRGVVKCVRCGCDRPELLEINHKNGGGAKELTGRSQQFIRDIVTLRRSTDDLELLCKPCNAIHALELVHGKLPMRVVWSRS